MNRAAMLAQIEIVPVIAVAYKVDHGKRDTVSLMWVYGNRVALDKRRGLATPPGAA